MGGFDDLSRNYATHGAQWLPPIIEEAAEALGISDEATKATLGGYIAKGYMAGIDAGQSEIMAQAAEQGYDISVDHQRPRDGA
jgi:hypothetical protein